MTLMPINHPPDVRPVRPNPRVLPPGTPVAPVPLPTGDVVLQNGLRLHYHGIETVRLPPSLGGLPSDPGTALAVWFGPAGLKIMGSLDATPHGTFLHLSISTPKADPSWRMLALIKDAFYGDVDCAMILPRAADYANVSRHCFQLWQVPVVWGVK